MSSVQDTTRTSAQAHTDPERIQDRQWTLSEAWNRYGPWVVTVINVTIFLCIWEAVTRAGLVNLTTTAPPGAIVSGSILDHVLYTLTNLAIGLSIACAIGIPAGLLMGGNRYVETVLSPYVWSLTSLPRIALVPLFILFMGFTVQMQITIIVLSAVFPIMINSWAGVKTTEKSLLAAAKVFGASRRELYLKVVLPYTLPFIVSGIQQGIGRGLVGVIIAEIFGGSQGLGYLIQRSADTFDSALMYSVLFVLVAISLTLVQFTRWIEAYVAPWRKIDML